MLQPITRYTRDAVDAGEQGTRSPRGGSHPLLLLTVRDVAHDAEDEKRILGLQVHQHGDGRARGGRLDDFIVVHAWHHDVASHPFPLPPPEGGAVCISTHISREHAFAASATDKASTNEVKMGGWVFFFG